MSVPSTPVPAILYAKPAWPSLLVEGPDSASWLQGLLTCHVLGVEAGHGKWGSLLTKQGKIQADLQICGRSDRLVIAVSGGVASDVLETLDGYLVMEDSQVSLADFHWVVAAGEGAALALETRGLEPQALPWGGGVPVVAAFLRSDELSKLEGIPWAPPEDWETLRIRHGWFKYGVDYSSADNLHAASLERRTVDWKKGCYLGQEVVCMQDMRGKVKRRLVVAESLDGASPAPGTLVAAEDATGLGMDAGGVGEVRSSAGQFAVLSVAVPHDEVGSVLVASGCRLRVRALV